MFSENDMGRAKSRHCRKAFTLIELLVVIGILGLLTSVLMVSMSGGSESAKAAKCLSNMKNLATAVQSRASNATYYPVAGSVEKLEYKANKSATQVEKIYKELPGWMSWSSQGQYPSSSTKGSSSWYVSSYNEDLDIRSHAITNGVLWQYLSGNREVFVCPAHKIAMAKYNPLFTYVMNEAFGWASISTPRSDSYYGKKYGTLGRADRVLLFAEFQWKDLSNWKASSLSPTGSDTDYDCVLQYDSNDEAIGFNHQSGRDKVAHIVFADGHTEKLTYPKKGLSASELKNLTEWLCTGKDVSFNGVKYEELND